MQVTSNVGPSAARPTTVADGDGAPAAGPQSLSDAGLALIKDFESLRLTAYRDAVGVWTIGWGHTGNVRPGDRITEAEAEALLRSDTAWAEQAVRDLVTVPLTAGQFDALTSFTFNVGAGALASSTLLRRLNAGDYEGAQAQFGRWVYGDGEVLPGLVRRRAAEAELFGSTPPAEAAASTTLREMALLPPPR